jgi:hypothetical protein
MSRKAIVIFAAYLFGSARKVGESTWQFAGASKVSMTGEVKIAAISSLKAPVIDFSAEYPSAGLGNKIKLLAQAIVKV